MAKETKKSGKKVTQFTITGPTTENNEKCGVIFAGGIGVTTDKDAADWFKYGLKWDVQESEIDAPEQKVEGE